ncbi:MAG: type IV pilus twitching motility protein PilT [Halanaerobiales bacterium]|nr:type IV pilus twitching motility protein PilT [Halanaerobiales bacterium]
MDLMDLLHKVVEDSTISDLHLTVNSKPVIRDTGELKIYEDYPKLSFQDMQEIARGLMTEEQWRLFSESGELDFSYSIPGFSRFRVNSYYQRGAISLALRVIPTRIPTIEELGMPAILKSLAMQRKGLVLCTGPTGSGKSTTLAAMIDQINENRRCHILTLEDPIEYLHHHKKCIVHQREVGIDTQSFAHGLRAALRQDPDVILVGEMRDLETIAIALEAAETGHLVLATLHTSDAPKTVDRIIDVFPAEQQQQVRIQLSSTLNGIIAQSLLPQKNTRGQVAAVEVLIGTPAVRNIIREGKSAQLYSVMQTGAKYGMIVLNNYLIQLYEQDLIELETAIHRSNNPDYIRKGVRRLEGI